VGSALGRLLNEQGLTAESQVPKSRELKKIGAESGDPNLHPQPRLPGSVVGEASIGEGWRSDKITADTGHR